MYLGIDVGGTKTLFAVFSLEGKIVYEKKIPTNKSYERFLGDVDKLVSSEIKKDFDIRCVCAAIPGRVDRKRGIGVNFGNLDWHNIPVKEDLGRILNGPPVLVENDANLGGLSEALAHKKYKKVLYLTVSTGIGDGLIVDGKIDPEFADSEAGQMVINHDGKIQIWEQVASGKALKKRYGKMASEINDASIWRAYSVDLAVGLQELLAVIQPDVVIFGGGVGAHFEKFGAYLEGELYKMSNQMVPRPPIIKANRPEEAVIYGCYDFIHQQFA
jgi:predicted NBD/HSP70 family sugar kinase